jgi:hypothetical protein
MSFWRGELIRVLARVKALEDQADPVLVALAELDATAGLIEQTGAATFAKRPLSAFMRSVLDDPDAAAVFTTLGVSAFIQTLLDDPDAATARGTLGANDAANLTIGTLPPPRIVGANGLVARTSASAWAARTITGPAAGIAVTNGNGVSGNPTLALANDLAALEGLGSTGLAARTAADTWAQRTITGTANEIDVTNGDGVSGNPTLALSATIGAAKAFRRGNILATVSQSAGVPTGGLIERGSNANGEYVRFADGTQICTSVITMVHVNTSNVGVTWTYPAAFAAAPGLSLHLNALSAAPSTAEMSIFVANAASTTSVSTFLSRISGGTNFVAGNTATVSAMAIGRWF